MPHASTYHVTLRGDVFDAILKLTKGCRARGRSAQAFDAKVKRTLDTICGEEAPPGLADRVQYEMARVYCAHAYDL